MTLRKAPSEKLESFRRLSVMALCLFAFVIGGASRAFGQSPMVVNGLGKGAVSLDSAWTFHTGDDARWAQPDYNDAGWEPISVTSPWGAQSHPGYTGIAWYRLHLRISSVANANASLELLMPQVNDAYEIYWNGRLIGQCGTLPPHPHWYYSTLLRTFPLEATGEGTLAIRVWKSPLLFVDPDSLGGMYDPPVLGERDTIEAELAAINAQSAHEIAYQYTLMILYGMVALLSLLWWNRDRTARLFLWLAVFTATPVVLMLFSGWFPIPILYGPCRALLQPVYALNHIALWFLLLYLLELREHQRLFRYTEWLAIATFAAGVLDGALALFWGNAGPWMQGADAILTTVILVVEVLPFVLIGFAIRQTLDTSRWLVAISAMVSQLIGTVADASAAGQRFTHWTLFHQIDRPLFTLLGVDFRAANLIEIVLFAAILYAVYRYSLDEQARRGLLEREMHSAQEIQKILIPDALPAFEGYAITSAYRPALEVGGDFFQVIREDSGSTIVVLGDVSGKGLKAAMNVALIVGVLRAMPAANLSTAVMMERLNRCLCGRMKNGFATAVILRVHADGSVALTNAGHLPPFLNQDEIPVQGSLPLGILSVAEYEEEALALSPGDHLSLYTDGVLEARNAQGELFGFDRVRSLFSARPSAQRAMEAAIEFGQDDDITVLTLTRLAAWQEATTSLDAPEYE